MRQEYLNSIKAGAIEGWYKYKITPSLTAAQAALESGWGTSKLAAPPYNNNFGIKAGADWTGRTASMTTQEWNGSKYITIVDTFRAYDSINDSVEDHGAFFTSTEWRINNYRNVVGEGDYKKACHAVANAGYATDPNYASKLINIIETYNLQSWDVEAQNGNPNNATMENTKASKIVGGAISSAASQSVSSLLLSVIGDSLGVGTEKFLKKYPWAKAFYDNLGSRQWTHATASLDATKILQTMLNNGNLQRNVVFILGTNRGVTAGEIDNVVSMCGRDRNIILVDTASEVNHRNVVSNAYNEASKRHENVYYANWSDYARANIATWYHADGANGTRIHMKDAGYQKHAEFIIQAVYEAANTNWVEAVSTPTEKNTERVNIYDVEYNDGKYTSPKGDSSIYNKELNDQLGFRPKKAQIMWIERKYTGEEDNAADLLEAALKKMDEYSVPAAQYTVPMRYFPPDVSIGDTGYFIDHEFNPPLYIYARVLSMTTSVSNPANDSVVIGNVIEVHPKDKADILALQKELQESREEARLEYWKLPPIVLQMISSNGLNFKTKPGELYSDLVHSTVKNPEVKNGFVDIPVHNAKKVGARISITGSIKDNYIDIVDEITSEINAPIPEEVFTGPVDPNSNPQGNTVKDITAPLDVRQLIVKQLDVRLLDSDGLNMGTTTLSVYEDSTFALKTEGLPKHINKIRILSNQNLVLDDISALDMSDPVSGAADKTRLYVKAFQEDTEVTHKFKNFSWSRISSNKRLDEEWNDANKFNETNGIDLTPSDVFGNESTFVCKMFDENGKFIAATSSSVTITKEGNKNTVSDSTMPPRDPSPGDKWTAIDGDSEEEYYYVDGEWVQTGVSKKVDEAIQEAEQAKADAIKAYNDAIAETERLVIEQDEVWQGKMNDYDEQVAQIEANVQSAQDKANQALTDVGISTNLAQTAKDLATTVESNVSTAISNASQAISDASVALNLATQAKSDVSTISLDVDDLAGQVALKANKTVVDQLSGTVNNHTADISANAQAIQSRLTSTQVNSLVDGKGFATQTWANNQITATANGINANLTKVEGKIDSIEVGGANLIKNSEDLSSQMSGYSGATSTVVPIDMTNEWGFSQAYDVYLQGGDYAMKSVWTSSNRVTEPMVPGQQYTHSFWIKNLGSGNSLQIATNGLEPNKTITLAPGESIRYQHTGVRRQDYDWYQIHFRSMAAGSNIRFAVGRFKLEKGNKATDWSPAPQDVMDYTDTQIDIKAGQVTTSLTSLINTKATQSDINTAILNDKSIKDTRNDNQTPNWYNTNYPRQTVTEFKTTSAMGIAGGSTYGLLTTEVIWNHTSGGTIKQTLKDNTDTYTRQSNTAYTAWGPWVKMADQTYVNTKITTTANGIEQLITQVKTNPTGTITGYNSLKNNVDSMVQAIGSDGGKIAQMVMTDSLFSTKVLEQVNVGGTNLLKSTSNQLKSFSTQPWYNLVDGGSKSALSTYGLSAGDTVTFRVYIKSTSGHGGSARLTMFRADGTYSSSVGNAIQNGQSGYSVITTTIPTDRTELHVGITNTINPGVTSSTLQYKEAKLEKGNVATDWSPAPEDKANQSEVTQLSNSWALTLKSGNDIKTQINASTSSLRLSSKFIHLNGSSLIDNATIKSAHIDTLNANKITGSTADFNTVRAGVLTTDVVTSTHIKADNALIDTIFATSALIGRLTSKTAFINNIKAISIDVDKITGNTASFFQTAWQGLNSSVTVDSSKVRLTNSAKDFIELNGIPEVRSQDSAGTAAIMGKGRSHYYSGSQARFYVGSNLEGLAQYGIHIAKGQTFGIYRNSDTYGGTPAQYHVVVKGESWRSITTKYWNDKTSVDVLMKLNGYNVNNYPDLQIGDTVLIKAAVAGNESGVERLWTMGTSSSGATRLYSHPEHIFEYRIEVHDRARFIAKALFENSFTNNSDRRIKHDIKDTEVTALDHLDSLTFKEYKLNSTGQKVPLGLIAQDSGILRVKGEDEGDYEGIDGLLMPMLAMKGVQELHAIVKAQAEKIKQLEEKINK